MLQEFRKQRSHAFVSTERVINHKRNLLRILIDSLILAMFKSKYTKTYTLVQTELIQGSPMTSVMREVRLDVHNGPFWLHNL